MEFALKKISVSSTCCSLPKIFPSHYHSNKNSRLLAKIGYGNQWNDTVLLSSSSPTTSSAVACSAGDVQRQISSLESLFCYDKPIPEQIIEKPVGLSLAEKNVGDNSRCPSCLTKGAVLCATCSGSGLYVDSILESQGIIVKVRCLEVVEEPGILYVRNAVAGVIFELISYTRSLLCHVLNQSVIIIINCILIPTTILGLVA
ncbi:hypothetical protein OROHE_015845 [Orobanche hederae]